jgi:DNA-binding transcriptional LysR family regulator
LAKAHDEVMSLGADPSGAVRLTASVAFGETKIAPLLPAFHAAFPRLELDVILSDANLDLVAERIDVAIRLAPSYRADVIGVRLFPTRYRVVASPAYVTAAGQPDAPSALAARDCLRFALPEFRSRWLFRRGKDITEVPVKGWLLTSGALSLRSATLSGLGPALLADWLIGEDLAQGRLVDLFPDYDVAATDFETGAWLLYPSRAHLPKKLRATIDFLRIHLVQAA